MLYFPKTKISIIIIGEQHIMTIPYQIPLRPALPNIYGGALDFRKFRDQLSQIDNLLRYSDAEESLVSSALKRWEELSVKNGTKITFASRQKQQRILHYALRCNIARHLKGLSFRTFSMRLADSTLLQWFTGINFFDHKKAASKSSIERYDKYFSITEVQAAIDCLISQAAGSEGSSKLPGLEETISLENVFADSTCIKANIHFPVDWVLLRDAVRTLTKSIILIRGQGLKHRMPKPSNFITHVNQLCIEMTHARRRPDSRKERKRILREMKSLAGIIRRHGKTYRALLKSGWEETEWSEAQMKQVLKRIDNVLSQLPRAIKQAHERIIGERRVKNNDKILSLYENNVHVITRGKAGAEVEFGNGLYLAEQENGLIVDWKLFEDQPPSDTKLVKESLDRMIERYRSISSFCTDRGFDSPKNRKLLEEYMIYNAICPRSPKLMKERREESEFVSLQTRRAQTEGRVGIFKNSYLGRPLRSKGFEHKENTVVWCVLTHNLWVLARMIQTEERQQKAA